MISNGKNKPECIGDKKKTTVTYLSPIGMLFIVTNI